MTRAIAYFAIVVALAGMAFWLLMLEGSAPRDGAGSFDLRAARAEVQRSGDLPTEMRVEILGTDRALGFAAESGAFGEDYNVACTAVLGQVRDLSNLLASNPNVTIVPSHDLDYLRSLIRAKKLALGFQLQG